MTVRFWKDGEKFTERELDSYWNGREEEQDYIIKMLENLIDEIESDYCCAEDDGNRLAGIAQAIALIKGEEK